MRPRMGFALVRINRSAPASEPVQRRARLVGVPPIAGFAAPARVPNLVVIGNEHRSTPDVRDRTCSPCYRCDWLALIECMRGLGCNQRSIRPEPM